ncbi:hypothetical protein SHKM778_12590 [Streptomyces sp. KM77-8]|uniref:Uncharacterized protein n=1 Tax=Streptomyces haneummycinicus TaxID=3074435 RepID=A0AAT9HBV2_9ACTN
MNTVERTPSSDDASATLRVIAGARRDDTGGPLLGQQPGDPDVRAAQLERPRPLEVLALQMDRGGREAGQVPAPSITVVRATPDSIFWAPRTSSRVTARREPAVL